MSQLKTSLLDHISWALRRKSPDVWNGQDGQVEVMVRVVLML